MSSVDEMMKKALTTSNDFYSKTNQVQGYKDKKDAIRAERKAQKDTLSQWYGMKKAKLSQSDHEELELLQYRNFINPDVQHQAPKKAGSTSSDFVEFGYFSDVGRNRRKRYHSFADEWIEENPDFTDIVKKRLKRNVKVHKKAKEVAAKKSAARAAREKEKRVSKRKSKKDNLML